MAKVFRLHNTGLSLEDWFVSTPVGSEITDNMKAQDSRGTRQPSSIPSPFARIDLVRSAFKKVAESGDLDSVTDAHKLVSDSLDVGQMLFNYEKHKDALGLTKWNVKERLEALVNSTNPKHKHLAETIGLFLDQDGKQYNFNKMDDVYILKYNHQVVGGTSPKTLFYASPRSEEMDVNIKFAKDKMLDELILPLYKRERAFILYMFSLKKGIDGFAEMFPEVSLYLDENLDALEKYDSEMFNEVHELSVNALENFSRMSMPGQEGVPVEVLSGIPLHQAEKQEPTESDFKIKSSKSVIGQTPLVLPVDPFTKKWTYTTGIWDSSTKVPHFDPAPLEKRRLPDQQDEYPYLTQNDFLSSAIIKLPYQINSKKFLCAGSSKFLLPLTERFFNYFNTNDIGSTVKIEIMEHENFDGLTKVKLSIPLVNGDFIQYEKTYKAPSSAFSQISDSERDGVVVNSQLGLLINPFIKSKYPIQYDVATVAMSDLDKDVSISPFKDSSDEFQSVSVYSKQRSSQDSRHTHHNIIDAHFDVLKISVRGAVNFLIPRFSEASQSGDAYKFAIDFGTTNTHVEYSKIGRHQTDSFVINPGEEQVSFIRDHSVELRGEAKVDNEDGEGYLLQESIPLLIGSDNLYRFPNRTVILENRSVDYDTETRLFSDANIGFDYEKRTIKAHLAARSELKWSDVNSAANRRRIQLFLEEILSLCKHKVISLGGELSRTEFIWFFPTSMAQSRRTRLSDLWAKAIDNVFKGEVSTQAIRPMSESIAPYYFYKSFRALMTNVAPTVSVDIGGGTSDVVAFENGIPRLVSSFKYAGNSIFGDSFNSSPERNGFALRFESNYERLLEKNDLKAEKAVLRQIFEKTNTSSDFVNFLFSLSSNHHVKESNAPIDFEAELKEDDSMKIVFVLYYAALFYHVAQLMKMSGLNQPANILFSGTGSKTFFILNGNDSDFTPSNKMIRAIFSHVYSEELKRELTIEIEKNPKEITAKGGLSADLDSVPMVDDHVIVHLGGKKDFTVQRPFSVQHENVLFKEVGEAEIQDVKDNVKDFLDMFKAINERISFNHTFGVKNESYQTFSDLANDEDRMTDYILAGFEIRKKDAGNEDEPLRESMFFLPIQGMLNELAYRISQSS